MPPAKRKTKAAEAEAVPVATPADVYASEPNERYVPGATEWEPAKIIIRPKDQVPLSEKELTEEKTQYLRALNPEAPKTIVRFAFKDRSWKLDAGVDQTEVHYAQEGNLLHVQSDEAKRQKEREADEAAALQREADKHKQDGEGAEAEGDTNLRNQFNFSERASQTLNPPLRERGTMTEPPPSVEYSAQCSPVRVALHPAASRPAQRTYPPATRP